MGQCDCLGGIHSYKEGSSESRPAGNGDAVQVAPLGLGLSHCLLDDRGNSEKMLAGSHLWYYASKSRMDVYLGGDDTGERLPSILYHGGRCLITGGFDTEDFHCFIFLALRNYSKCSA